MNPTPSRLARALVAALLLAAPIVGSAQTSPVLKSGTWWNANESGWGLFTIDQGNVIAPGWFTYGPDGKPTWYLVPGAFLQADGSYSGNVCRFTGVPFAQIMGTAADPCQVIGTASLRFTGNTALSFQYTVDGVTQTKSLTRFPFANRDVVCRASATPSRAAATNFSDLWWSGPASEGWGIQMSHVDNSLFATWYTYDTDRKAIFYVGATTRQADGSFTGPLLRQNNGTPFNMINGTPPSSGATQIGTVTIRFTDGQTATFTYTVGTVTQTKNISRFQFGSTASVCENIAFGTIDSGGGNPTPGANECYPPLAVGDRYRTRSTPGTGTIGLTDAEVIGTGVDPFQGRPVFRIKYTPVNQPSSGDVIEFVEQTATEHIYYGSEGFIPEANVTGTTRFDPPVRIPRSIAVGASGRLQYQAISNYTSMGQPVSLTSTFDESYQRIANETQASPAGTFNGACKFNATVNFVSNAPTAGFNVRTEGTATVVRWSHPSIGGFRANSSSTTTVTTTGAPFPIPPTTTSGTDVSEIITATIGGRTFP